MEVRSPSHSLPRPSSQGFDLHSLRVPSDGSRASLTAPLDQGVALLGLDLPRLKSCSSYLHTGAATAILFMELQLLAVHRALSLSPRGPQTAAAASRVSLMAPA
ncbi:hypothetical protein NDU88_003102 [Pleurodeles waltl]|uniref:Uncharacterized protein n=1 Tax=Pleurodeles waltl TaxID=8319 RepID=A0AAV7KTY7_PLEWA|nr:hypothetical protein NDU88_003102 [Pleurodeles waltl]